MSYNTYQITIAGVNNMPKILDVVAVDNHAAIADVRSTYGEEVEVWCICLV